jgi:tetratricopeptide (TPR) repeat protein
MKIRSAITALILLTAAMPLFSEEAERNEILKLMIFPSADIRFGKTLNDPFFGLNIQKRNINYEETKKNIDEIEKNITDKSKPDLYFQLGNYYMDLSDSENAVKSYKRYLKLTSSTDLISAEDSNIILAKGEVYYSLYQIDLSTNRSDNLEKALLFFTRAVELNPQGITTWIKLGDCYLYSGKTTEAAYCYNKAAEKNKSDFQIYARLQSASFQGDYLKLSKNMIEDKKQTLPGIKDFNFDYIETAINNSSAEFKESLRIQHYIYFLRLMILNDEYNRKNMTIELKTGVSKGDGVMLSETEKLLKSSDSKNIEKYSIKYLTAVVNYLKGDYTRAIADFNEYNNLNGKRDSAYDDIIHINKNFVKNNSEYKKTIQEIIKINPKPEYYLIAGEIEFNDKNYSKAEMLCTQSLKINQNYAEAFSALAVVYSMNGNYIAADEMIKKGNLIIKNNKTGKELKTQMKVNEAAVALLKNEKERAYVLLRSVLSVDNNDKAQQLYNRYFIKK